jgi:hypothetical protein
MYGANIGNQLTNEAEEKALAAEVEVLKNAWLHAEANDLLDATEKESRYMTARDLECEKKQLGLLKALQGWQGRKLAKGILGITLDELQQIKDMAKETDAKVQTKEHEVEQLQAKRAAQNAVAAVVPAAAAAAVALPNTPANAAPSNAGNK